MVAMPLRVSTLAFLLVLLAGAQACGTSAPVGEDERASDDSVTLGIPDCPDEGVCAEAYEFRERVYIVTDSDVEMLRVEGFEAERLEVVSPEGIDELVLTDDPDVIYLLDGSNHAWLRAEATGSR